MTDLNCGKKIWKDNFDELTSIQMNSALTNLGYAAYVQETTPGLYWFRTTWFYGWICEEVQNGRCNS